MNRCDGSAAFRHQSTRGIVAALIFLLSAPESPAADGDDNESRAGHGSISAGFQYQTADTLQASTGEIYIGPVETYSLSVEVEYHLDDKWTVVGGIPYIRRRYRGDLQHDPLLLDPPRPEIENIDQGDWNHSFQDFHLGLRYLLFDSPTVTVEPHVFLGVPSHDYPFFGHAAVGQGQNRIEIGSSFVWSPGLSDAYYGLDVSYAFVDQVLGVNINHWRINAEAGYFFAPRLTGRAFALIKEGNGLDFPDDFPPPRNDERWYQHDRLVKHNYVILGAGLTWSLSDSYQLSTSWMTMTHAEVIHVMDHSFDITISHGF